MSFCSKCGTEVQDGINFCGKCGGSLNSDGGGGTSSVAGSKMLFRIIGKLGYIFVVIGFCMPIACDMNGFKLTDYMFDNNHALFGLLTILMLVCAVFGIIIGILLLVNKNVNAGIDWAATATCIASGLIVYLGFLKDDNVKLQSGAYVIMIGWITVIVFQIISLAGYKCENLDLDDIDLDDNVSMVAARASVNGDNLSGVVADGFCPNCKKKVDVSSTKARIYKICNYCGSKL